MLAPQETSKKRLTSNKDKKIKIFCWLVAGISIILVSSHNFVPTKNATVLEQQNIYKKAISERNNTYKRLKKAYQSSDKEFNTLMEKYINLQDVASYEYGVLNKKREKTKVFNFKNSNVFLYQISVFIVILIVSLLFKLLSLRLEFDKLVKTYSSLSNVFTSISFYYIVWVFYPKSDLPHFAHITAITLIAIFIGLFTNNVVGWIYQRNSIIASHKYNFRNIWRFIIRDIPKKHIDKNHIDEYVLDYKKEIENFKLPAK